MITLEEFDAITPETVFWTVTTNLLNRFLDVPAKEFEKNLTFICRKGYAGDWAIYYHYAYKGFSFISTQGDKLHLTFVPRIIQCPPEMLQRYRL